MIAATQKYKHYTIVYLSESPFQDEKTDDEIRQDTERDIEQMTHPPDIPEDHSVFP
jgi:hypothetical protein